jgi:spermidine/putrescine transport system substrate-binding protein
VLEQQVDSGQVKQVKGNSYKEDLINEQAWAAIGWSGDIFQINAEEGNKWEFALPDTGGTLWSDNLMIPVTASNPTGAAGAHGLLLPTLTSPPRWRPT